MAQTNRESTVRQTDELPGESNGSLKAGNIISNVADAGKERLEAEKRSAAEQTEKLADAVGRAGEELDRGDFPFIANYANQLAMRMKNFANGLRDRSLEELIEEVRHSARRNPELFFLGSIAAGVGLARFVKASQRREAGEWGRAARSYDADYDGGAATDGGSEGSSAGARARADVGDGVKGA